MSYTSRGNSEILVAGLQDQMFTIDVDKGTVTKQVQKLWKFTELLLND
jgi:PAB-dependent poly(A)-specific ribonuclease subunit 2